MKLDRLLFVFLVLGIFLILYKGSVYVIGEDEQAVVTQFGKILKSHAEPGIYFKIPGMHQTHFFSKAVYRTESVYQVQTIDKKSLSLTVQSSWKIIDPALFLTSIRDTASAENKVRDLIQPALKAALASFRLDDFADDANTADYNHLKRKTDIEKNVLKFAQPKLRKFGIALIKID